MDKIYISNKSLKYFKCYINHIKTKRFTQNDFSLYSIPTIPLSFRPQNKWADHVARMVITRY
jgi:hypothetical protein